ERLEKNQTILSAPSITQLMKPFKGTDLPSNLYHIDNIDRYRYAVSVLEAQSIANEIFQQQSRLNTKLNQEKNINQVVALSKKAYFYIERILQKQAEILEFKELLNNAIDERENLDDVQKRLVATNKKLKDLKQILEESPLLEVKKDQLRALKKESEQLEKEIVIKEEGVQTLQQEMDTVRQGTDGHEDLVKKLKLEKTLSEEQKGLEYTIVTIKEAISLIETKLTQSPVLCTVDFGVNHVERELRKVQELLSSIEKANYFIVDKWDTLEVSLQALESDAHQLVEIEQSTQNERVYIKTLEREILEYPDFINRLTIKIKFAEQSYQEVASKLEEKRHQWMRDMTQVRAREEGLETNGNTQADIEKEHAITQMVRQKLEGQEKKLESGEKELVVRKARISSMKEQRKEAERLLTQKQLELEEKRQEQTNKEAELRKRYGDADKTDNIISKNQMMIKIRDVIGRKDKLKEDLQEGKEIAIQFALRLIKDLPITNILEDQLKPIHSLNNIKALSFSDIELLKEGISQKTIELNILKQNLLTLKTFLVEPSEGYDLEIHVSELNNEIMDLKKSIFQKQCDLKTKLETVERFVQDIKDFDTEAWQKRLDEDLRKIDFQCTSSINDQPKQQQDIDATTFISILQLFDDLLYDIKKLGIESSDPSSEDFANIETEWNTLDSTDVTSSTSEPPFQGGNQAIIKPNFVEDNFNFANTNIELDINQDLLASFLEKINKDKVCKTTNLLRRYKSEFISLSNDIAQGEEMKEALTILKASIEQKQKEIAHKKQAKFEKKLEEKETLEKSIVQSEVTLQEVQQKIEKTTKFIEELRIEIQYKENQARYLEEEHARKTIELEGIQQEVEKIQYVVKCHEQAKINLQNKLKEVEQIEVDIAQKRMELEVLEQEKKDLVEFERTQRKKAEQRYKKATKKIKQIIANQQQLKEADERVKESQDSAPHQEEDIQTNLPNNLKEIEQAEVDIAQKQLEKLEHEKQEIWNSSMQLRVKLQTIFDNKSKAIKRIKGDIAQKQLELGKLEQEIKINQQDVEQQEIKENLQSKLKEIQRIKDDITQTELELKNRRQEKKETQQAKSDYESEKDLQGQLNEEMRIKGDIAQKQLELGKVERKLARIKKSIDTQENETLKLFLQGELDWITEARECCCC
ncbi:LIM-type zinc finger-containing protein, partial [Reticulomyxa filosa]